MAVSDASDDRRELIVKIDQAASAVHDSSINNPSSREMESAVNTSERKIWRESSYDFRNDGDGRRRKNSNGEGTNGGGMIEDFEFRQQRYKDVDQDPHSKLIGEFLHKQKASGEMSLDMDVFEMLELPPEEKTLPPMKRSSPDQLMNVSFESNSEISENDSIRRRLRDSRPVDEEHRDQRQQSQQRDRRAYGDGTHKNDDGAKAMKCTSNSSIQKKSSFLGVKTKSRLLDPPEQPDRRSRKASKSGRIRSGSKSKPLDDEEDDPFWEEDLPDEYKKSNFGVLTLLQWASLILIITASICTLTIRYWRRKKLWKLELWKWEVTILVLICGRLFSGWGIRILIFFIERNFLLRKRVLYFVYGVRKAVQNCLWLGLVLIAWKFLFDDKVKREVKSHALEYVTKVLVCLLISTLVWLVKTLMVKVLASSFHVITFFDRIQDALFNQYVIETLSGFPLIEIQKKKDEEEDQRVAEEEEEVMKFRKGIPTISIQKSAGGLRLIGSGSRSPNNLSRVLSKKGDHHEATGITIDHLHKLSPKNVSAWNMKRLMKIVRHGALATVDEHMMNKDSSTDYDHDQEDDDESATQIMSEYEAEVAAKKIFQNVARESST